MNDQLNTDTYHYRVNQLHRDDAMRAAEQERLARLAAGGASERHHLMAELIRRVRQFFTHHLSRGSGHNTGKTHHPMPTALHIRHNPHGNYHKPGAAGKNARQHRPAH